MNFRDLVNKALQPFPPVHRVAVAAAHPTHRGQRPAAIWRAVKYETLTRLGGRSLTVPIGERSHIVVRKGETNAPQALTRNPPNWPEMLVWKNELGPGSLFVDVGANIGVYSVYAAEQGADVIAVEPNAHNAARVREHLAMNGYVGEVVEKALLNKPGIVRMTDDLDSLNHIVATGGVEVEATTLDELVGTRKAGVKIDVEGAEALVLNGARKALTEHRLDPIQLEWEIGDHMVETDRSSVQAILVEHDYELYVATRDGNLTPVSWQVNTLNVFARPVQAN